MANIVMLVAVTFFVLAIIVAISTNNSWKSVAYTYGLLGIGIVFFGISLTL